jgi:hypothetical protein
MNGPQRGAASNSMTTSLVHVTDWWILTRRIWAKNLVITLPNDDRLPSNLDILEFSILYLHLVQDALTIRFTILNARYDVHDVMPDISRRDHFEGRWVRVCGTKKSIRLCNMDEVAQGDLIIVVL